jgi:hypothetical protein
MAQPGASAQRGLRYEQEHDAEVVQDRLMHEPAVSLGDVREKGHGRGFMKVV